MSLDEELLVIPGMICALVGDAFIIKMASTTINGRREAKRLENAVIHTAQDMAPDLVAELIEN